MREGNRHGGDHHEARTLAMETLNGKVAEHVAVDAARVPMRGGQAMSSSGPVPVETRRLTTVPSGIFAAARLTAAAPEALMVTSGVRYSPDGCAGTGTPFT